MAHMLPPRHMLPPEQGPNPQLVRKIVQELKINGVFDEMRKECLADIDTKPAFLNLKQRVEGHVKSILANQEWSPALNKNQLRSRIRESVMQSGILNEGVDRILYQVFSAKAVPIFLPKIQEFVKDNREELMKEFLPPPMQMPQMMMNPPPFGPMQMPVLPEMQPELFPPPMPPSQPPPPESPVIPGPSDQVQSEELPQQSQTEQIESVHEMTEEVLTYEDQEFYVKDVAPEDVVVKAIRTPSPQPSTPDLSEDSAPKIPEDAVNPLRSLIQTLLVSKQTILETDGEVQQTVVGRMEVTEEVVKFEGCSPTIDSSQIEGFTDDEEEVEEYIPAPGPRTPTDGRITYEPSESKYPCTPSPENASPVSPESEPHTPHGIYSPLSPGQVLDDNGAVSDKKPITPSRNEAAQKSDSDSRMTDERSTPAYDPSKFSYQQMSDSTPLNEDDNAQSPPSPTEVTDTTERSQYTDGAAVFSEESKYDTDMRQRSLVENRKAKKRSRSSSDSSGSSSSSGSVSSSPSSEDEKDETVVPQEQVVEQVEEMVEEIEVVEEFTSGGSAEEGEQLNSDEKEQEEAEEGEQQQQQRSPAKSLKEKKKKKKTKKRKAKKPKKRARTSSISSGEITSSGELSSDSSSDSNRPTRPTHPPRKKSIDLEELEERRRVLREESMHDRPYWANTGSSSEYLSSPGRPRRPFSPRRPYSPEFRRYEDDLGYGPPPGPHFRDRPVFVGEYHPRHSRFSPPYRRSSPHRYSPGPRMDYPRIPFGSPRSPPRRPYSPPHMMGGYSRDRPPFPPPHHRWGSPPRQGPRRLSRSPPPGMRRDGGPGPSRY